MLKIVVPPKLAANPEHVVSDGGKAWELVLNGLGTAASMGHVPYYTDRSPERCKHVFTGTQEETLKSVQEVVNHAP